MKIHAFTLSVLALVFALSIGSQCAVAGPAAKTMATTNAVAQLPVFEIPQSVFVIPATPKEGRNPFFPQAAVVGPIVHTKQASVDTQAFVLNGITSPPKQTAMINGYTFEPGEEHEVRLPGGAKIMVKCEQIKNDSATILAAGVRRELRLRFGL